MRIFIILWLIPLTFFWGWYTLSYFDLHMGIDFFRRQTHDVVFALYAHILKMPVGEVPWFIAKIFALDSLFIVAIAAWRWRANWYPQLNAWFLRTFFPAMPAEESETALRQYPSDFHADLQDGPIHLVK